MAGRTKDSRPPAGATQLRIGRRLSRADAHPFSRVSWVRRDARIANEQGEVVFEQLDVEVPERWSQLATNIVASKYFRGKVGSAQRETSVRQLIARVVEPIARWGREDGYFAEAEEERIFQEELTAILLEQYAAFNSPVWFNVGVEVKPQCSACFILSVDDTLSSLLELQRLEVELFRYGSGAGTNLSRIRSRDEPIAEGGGAAGPLAFMRGFDAWAGTIKSGGRTRRAAKMQILDCDHPDILEFIQAKRFEEEKAHALIEQGYEAGFNQAGGAYDSVFFQNANFSVRVSDEFMRAAVEQRPFTLRLRTSGELGQEV